MLSAHRRGVMTHTEKPKQRAPKNASSMGHVIPRALDDLIAQIAYRRYRGFRILAMGVSSVPDTVGTFGRCLRRPVLLEPSDPKQAICPHRPISKPPSEALQAGLCCTRTSPSLAPRDKGIPVAVRRTSSQNRIIEPSARLTTDPTRLTNVTVGKEKTGLRLLA